MCLPTLEALEKQPTSDLPCPARCPRRQTQWRRSGFVCSGRAGVWTSCHIGKTQISTTSRVGPNLALHCLWLGTSSSQGRASATRKYSFCPRVICGWKNSPGRSWMLLAGSRCGDGRRSSGGSDDASGRVEPFDRRGSSHGAEGVDATGREVRRRASDFHRSHIKHRSASISRCNVALVMPLREVKDAGRNRSAEEGFECFDCRAESDDEVGEARRDGTRRGGQDDRRMAGAADASGRLMRRSWDRESIRRRCTTPTTRRTMRGRRRRGGGCGVRVLDVCL